MAYFAISVVAPHATAYDEDYPTRSTENYAHALHEVLQDMEDASFYLSDGGLGGGIDTGLKAFIEDCYEAVFDMADTAITEHRAEETLTITEPVMSDLPTPAWYLLLPPSAEFVFKIRAECLGMMYKIYYMWMTEEDPLLIKEKLQELLIAWPLLDTTIELSEDMGQSFKVYPSWKNADL